MPRANPDVVTISEFRTACVAIIERVRATGRHVLVTKHGELIAEVTPPRRVAPAVDWIGSMKGTAEIVGDVVSPLRIRPTAQRRTRHR